MKITFDPAKRDTTLRERGLDMALAGEVFEGAHITFEDDRRDYGDLALSRSEGSATGLCSSLGLRVVTRIGSSA